MQFISYASHLFTCLLLALLIPTTNAQFQPLPYCENSSDNYTQGSQFESNLILLLQFLASNTTNDFSLKSSGTKPDDVYGLLLCKVDITPQECQVCAKSSASGILQRCPYRKQATIFSDNCWVRYADYRFFGIPSTDPVQRLYNGNDIGNPDFVVKQLRTLMNDLISTAASSPTKFANRSFIDVININGMVQCTKDLSPGNCSTCLEAIFQSFLKCCYGKQSGIARSTTCVFRYDIYPYFKTQDGPKKEALSVRGKFAIVAAMTGTFIVTSIVTICYYLRRKSNSSTMLSERKLKNGKNVEAFLRNWGSFAPTRYKFSDVKRMTHSFEDKIGQGGYGSVFKGELPDGQMVAVKVLSEVKGDGNEFINEVESISKTSHVNIVSLLGFCVEGMKRALIYEFMPNGSLEKYIYNEIPPKAQTHLGWDILYKVAIGIARGLEYLHRGCNTRILHFDIKPHNILLDHDFSPKIADFGLSKLCHLKESIISITGARGTPGYIAPEVVSRNFGAVSHKSDVYSYGMMVLEMVGGRKNIDPTVNNRSEIYFPHWIYKRLYHNEDLGLYGTTSSEGGEIAQKMILVGLWCIQIDPLNRPPMSKVLEMLEGSLEALEIPPKPFLASPPRSDFSSTSTL